MRRRGGCWVRYSVWFWRLHSFCQPLGVWAVQRYEYEVQGVKIQPGCFTDRAALQCLLPRLPSGPLDRFPPSPLIPAIQQTKQITRHMKSSLKVQPPRGQVMRIVVLDSGGDATVEGRNRGGPGGEHRRRRTSPRTGVSVPPARSIQQRGTGRSAGQTGVLSSGPESVVVWLLCPRSFGA